MKKNSGFTLIKLMIVVAIIAIIAAIAIPNLLRSRMSANEAGAAGAMRTISTGEVAFQTAAFVDTDGDGVGDYGTLAQLANPDGAGATPPFIDNVLGGGNKHGYVFTLTVTNGSPTQVRKIFSPERAKGEILGDGVNDPEKAVSILLDRLIEKDLLFI